jgi:hypothetical protein
MPRACTNKYQTALEILQKGRDVLVDELAEAVVDHGDDLIESPFLLTELLEGHGSKLQFLMILMSQLERTAEEHESLGTIRVACCDEPDPAAPRRRRRRPPAAAAAATPASTRTRARARAPPSSTPPTRSTSDPTPPSEHPAGHALPESSPGSAWPAPLPPESRGD